MKTITNRASSWLFCFIFFTQTSLLAQKIDRVVNASGGRAVLSGTMSLSYNIGEPLIFSGTGSNLVLTSGFEQPDSPLITSINSILITPSITVFPNPVTDKVYIHISDNSAHDFKMELYNLQGQEINRLYEQKSAFGGETFFLELASYRPGIYFINISSALNHISNTFKIIKE